MRAVVRTVVGADGVPMVASARCGSAVHEELALARQYRACDGSPVVVDRSITTSSP